MAEGDVVSGVTEGKNGWLFLTGGSNNVIEMYNNRDLFSDDFFSHWKSLLDARRRFFEAAGIRYRHVITPEKLSVYPELYNAHLGSYGYQPTGYRSAFSNIEFQNIIVNPLSDLLQAKHQQDTYLKTDSHWNIYGAGVAVTSICRSLGFKVEIDWKSHRFENWEMVLDLGSKLPEPPKEWKRFALIPDFVTRTQANSLVKLWEDCDVEQKPVPFHVGTGVTFENRSVSALDETVVLFGDSFSHFQSSNLTALLAEVFRKVHFIWSSSIDRNYTLSLKPSIVITQNVERFMLQIPTDTYDYLDDVNTKISSYYNRP